MTMLDRLARAIAIEGDPETKARATIPGYEPFVQEKHRALATAVLRELLTPTDGMVEAGCVGMFGEGSKPENGWPDYVKSSAKDVVQAAIQAAIEGE